MITYNLKFYAWTGYVLFDNNFWKFCVKPNFVSGEKIPKVKSQLILLLN